MTQEKTEQTNVQTEDQTIDQKEVQKQKGIILHFVMKVIILCAAIWVVFTFVFGVAVVKSEAMYPRLRDGDLAISYRLEKNYNISDVVAFEKNDYQRFARIVAQSGDVVELTEDGMLKVNGNIQEEEVHYPTEPIPGGITYPYTVPADSYFVLCDFRTLSSDSRDYGAISKSDIKGKVITLIRRRGI